MKNLLTAVAACAALFLFPGCRHGHHHDGRHPGGPYDHTHRVHPGRPTPVHHHPAHGARPLPPPPPHASRPPAPPAHH